MLTLTSLGREIAIHRTGKKWTQSQLAKKAGISRPTLAALENGRAAELGFSKVTRVLAALGLELKLLEANRERPTLEDLLKEEDADDQSLGRRS